jgi:hypothetical protein
VLFVRPSAPSTSVVASVFAAALIVTIGQPALANCPARISSATIIGSTTSGSSSVYAISVNIDWTPIEGPGPTIEMRGMHFYVRDEAGDETWIFVPDHNVSDWNHGRHLDYFSFGWRHAKRFQISIADLTVGNSPTVVCGNDWESGRSVSDAALDAGSTWDNWLGGNRPTVDFVEFRPARAVDQASVLMHPPDGPDSTTCWIVVSVDSSGHPTAFDVYKTSGYLPYDNECVDAARRSTYQAASFGPTHVSATLIVDWWYATIG